MRPYESDARFSDYYFEDSYLLAIHEWPDRIDWDLELVLTPTHAAYQPPGPSEQHCYRRGALRFEGVMDVIWRARAHSISTDADGSQDFGNLDVFQIDLVGAPTATGQGADRFYLEGSWGSVLITARSAAVHLDL